MIPYRLIAEIIGAIIIVVAFLLHEHSLVLKGERKCQAEDMALANKIATENAVNAAIAAKKLEDATNAWTQERAAIMAANKPWPTVRVCHDKTGGSSVPTTPAVPASGSPGIGDIRDDQPVHPDISLPLQLSSAYADRLVSDCRRLSESVRR